MTSLEALQNTRTLWETIREFDLVLVSNRRSKPVQISCAKDIARKIANLPKFEDGSQCYLCEINKGNCNECEYTKLQHASCLDGGEAFQDIFETEEMGRRLNPYIDVILDILNQIEEKITLDQS